jgi:hypothetical protein
MDISMRSRFGPSSTSEGRVDVTEHAVVSELLGVFALDACDDHERVAVTAHLVACGRCADETSRLGALVGWIGVGGLGPRGTPTPPRRLRERTLREAFGTESSSPSG